MKNFKRIIMVLSLAVVIITFMTVNVYAEPGISIEDGKITIGTSDNPKDTAASIQVLLVLTVLTLAPSILIMMTSFTRIIIVLSFLRNALGTQQMPPNQVLIGLALFLTFFIMTPTVTELNKEAFTPFSNAQISQDEALSRSTKIINKFMLKQTRKEDLGLFLKLSGNKEKLNEEELQKLPITTVTPAFMISELKTAFLIGFIIFIPFLVIDMIVSSTLMSMGMMMLPPVMISLPFKILLFIMVDGWNLVIGKLVSGFG